jgi:hypothetical protein
MILWRFHDVHELPGVVAQPASHFPQMLQIGRAISRAIFHFPGEKLGPIGYLGRIDKVTLS